MNELIEYYLNSDNTEAKKNNLKYNVKGRKRDSLNSVNSITTSLANSERVAQDKYSNSKGETSNSECSNSDCLNSECSYSDCSNIPKTHVFIYGSLKMGGGMSILRDSSDCRYHGDTSTLWPIYSAFKIYGPTTSIWSFLEIFRIIFGKKIIIIKIAFPARFPSSFYWAILKISIFWPKIILQISKNDQIFEPDQKFWTHCMI